MKGGGMAAFTRKGKEAAKEIFQIYSLILPVLILLFIFCYIPMYGVVIAFQNYVPGSPFIGKGVTWVGLKWILLFIQGEYFRRLIKNTLVLSGLNLAFGFTIPILFALLLDQIRRNTFRKFVQTASYLPYFISTVIVAGMVLSFINTETVFPVIIYARVKKPLKTESFQGLSVAF
jgi:putative aldouronate transport system permease protein